MRRKLQLEWGAKETETIKDATLHIIVNLSKDPNCLVNLDQKRKSELPNLHQQK